MSRVLVTGAGGFIGQPVIAELARSGRAVHALSRRSRTSLAPNVCWHRIDLEDSPAVAELMRDIEPECLVHIAWHAAPGQLWQAPENVVWVERSLHLMRAFVGCGGRRLVMIGTCAEYDWLACERALCEYRSRLAPATLYGAAKDALRRIAVAYALQERVELAWARPFFLYGPHEDPRRLVPSVIRSLLAESSATTGNGERIRDYMHVEDAASAIVALLDSTVVGEVNIASGDGVSVGEMVDRVVQLIEPAGPVCRRMLPDRLGEPLSLVADIGRLRDEVGYRPRWTLADGLAATVRWWKEQG